MSVYPRKLALRIWENLDQRGLYGGILVAFTLLWVATLGSGPWGTRWHWPYHLFHWVCHQDPQRSFWINGQPMAVCSRCFGIYSSLFLGWLLLPLVGGKLLPFMRRTRYLLGVAFLVNVVDVAGHFLGLWDNTVWTRLATGALLGLAAAAIFADEFIKKNLKYLSTKGE